MKIQINLSAISASASAPAFKKGDRVVCEIDTDEWHQAVVARGGRKIVVHFDDGHEADIEAADMKHVHAIPADTKPRKKALTAKQALALIASNTPKVVKTAPKTVATKSNAKLDEKLGLVKEQMVYGKPNTFVHYILGDKVPDAWIKAMSKRVSVDQPKLLYRLTLVSSTAKVGTTINVTKPLASASDRKINAIHAGCSYNTNNNIPLNGRGVALIEIKNPVCIASHAEIYNLIGDNMHELSDIVRDEREYFIRGPVKGKIIQMIDPALIEKDTYMKVHAYIRKKKKSPEAEQRILDFATAKKV